VNTTKINEWLQIIGMFGVIASLLFVGLQMKQTHEIALSATYQARTATAVDLSIGPITSPEWLAGVAKVNSEDIESLTKEEHVALLWEFFALMAVWENNHLQYELGFLPEEHWTRNANSMKCVFEVPYYRDKYSTADIRESFAAVVAEILKQAIENPSGCRSVTFPESQ
jgi:hypothetical protein